MSGNKYETVNTQVECEETFNPDAHMFLCQEPVGEVFDVESVIMVQLSLNAGMQQWKGKGQATDISETKKLHFKDTFKPKHYRDLS